MNASGLSDAGSTRHPALPAGLVGRLVEAREPRGAALVLWGSAGGVPEAAAERLAAAGVTALALGYFGLPGLVPQLVGVPLEYVERALVFLAARVEAPAGRAGIVGVSKGAELALLAATRFPALVGRVAAVSPSAVAWYGLDSDDPGRAPSGRRSSWSHAGREIPFAAPVAQVEPILSGAGLAIGPVFKAALAQLAADDPARIPLERAAGPILLLSGGDDHMWPAAPMAEMLVRRMVAAGRGDAVRHVRYRDAGHLLLGRPPADRGRPALFDFGGTPQADAAAAEAVWSELTRFLGPPSWAGDPPGVARRGAAGPRH